MGRLFNALRVLVRHPGLWVEGLRAAAAMARRGWWRRPPFLPIPDRRYLRWRLATAYGRNDADLTDGDLLAYLRWRQKRRGMS